MSPLPDRPEALAVGVRGPSENRLAELHGIDSDLAELIEAWQKAPDPIREAIQVLLGAGDGCWRTNAMVNG